MKRIVIIASALIAFASFGGQPDRLACAVTNSMQQSDAVVRYYLEVHRAIANRIIREQHGRAERLRLEIERAEAFERNRKASEEPGKKPFNYKSGKNQPDRQQTLVEAKQKKEDIR